MHERRRLLERLQHPVGRLVVHRVGPLDHEHAPRRFERRARRGRHDRLLDVADEHLRGAARRDPGQVGMRTRARPARPPRPGRARRRRAARPRTRARPRACRSRPDRGRGRRARARRRSRARASSTARACGCASMPGSAAAARGLRESAVGDGGTAKHPGALGRDAAGTAPYPTDPRGDDRYRPRRGARQADHDRGHRRRRQVDARPGARARARSAGRAVSGRAAARARRRRRVRADSRARQGSRAGGRAARGGTAVRGRARTARAGAARAAARRRARSCCSTGSSTPRSPTRAPGASWASRRCARSTASPPAACAPIARCCCGSTRRWVARASDERALEPDRLEREGERFFARDRRRLRRARARRARADPPDRRRTGARGRCCATRSRRSRICCSAARPHSRRR